MTIISGEKILRNNPSLPDNRSPKRSFCQYPRLQGAQLQLLVKKQTEVLLIG